MKVNKLTAISLAIGLALPVMVNAKTTNAQSETNVQSETKAEHAQVTSGNKALLQDAFSCEGETLTPIYAIQGDGASSPLVPDGAYESIEEYVAKGIVTARTESLYKGFFIQDAKGDGLASTSDGIFVHWGESAPDAIQPGVEVCVKGKVKEHYGFTQIDIKNEQKVDIGEIVGELPARPLQVKVGETLTQALERVEGMKVVLDTRSDMKVTRTFSFDNSIYRNNMVLSHKAPLFKATQVHQPLSAEAVALNDANLLNQLFIDTDIKAPAGVVPYFPGFNADTGYIRIGDQVTNLEGVVGFSDDQYRLLPLNELTAKDFIRKKDRKEIPAIAQMGDIRVSSFNVLNFFNSEFGGDKNPLGHNRGATLEAEMQLQRTKIVNAMVAMNADIIGLMEVENNGFGKLSAIQNLLDALNAKLPEEQAYQFVELDAADKAKGKFVGNDAISVGLFYRPAVVSLDGKAKMIMTPEQHAKTGAVSRMNGDVEELSPAYDKYQRHSMMQTFLINEQKLTVVVNHLKSKGSGCLEDWVNFNEDSEPEDLQGKCNAFRVSAAQVIGEAVKGLDGDVLVMGDINAYAKEDPLAVLTDYDSATTERVIRTASWTTLDGVTHQNQGSIIDKGYGLINLSTQAHGPETYSYSYNGELGNLDHALGNSSLAQRVVAVEDWHINAVESNLFEYSSKYTGELSKSENAFSSSDHDPVIIALEYPQVATEKDNRGGSLGYLGLMLLTALGLSRRKV
ncbi:ExeM/NucH family extracellular endonuclease [Shewanella olleyana]|uniref:ExeM/NucH family extracellular endonuclease n=1 Tax=Shewanella olleyana TaxID=135626 RepID=UPI00200EFFC1|nr:ExeM/NucH family extracellular endonuclease [Shewanella olleyana]MCL1067873.1 ExeM/NucH family extracellular endonuclease [Shewanella olleyana]